MKTAVAFVGLLLLTVLPCGAEIVGSGVYRGYPRVDRWGQQLLQIGPYALFVGDRVFEKLRGMVGQPVEVDAVEVFQPVNPGAGRIEVAGSIEPWELGASLELSARSTWVPAGDGVLLTLVVHNHAEPELWWPPDSLVLVITTRQPMGAPFDPDALRGGSWPYQVGFSNVLVPLLDGQEPEELYFAARKVLIEWSPDLLVSMTPSGLSRVPPGHTVSQQILAGPDLPPGEYEVFAFWDETRYADGFHGAQSNVIAFDVQEP